MKNIILLSLVAGLPALAGTSEKQVIAPAQESCLVKWFAGGSVGYLTEMEEPMYHLHLGADTCWNLGGWDVALFGEVGYVETDGEFSRERDWHDWPSSTIDQDTALNGHMDWERPSFDLNIIPITFNIKLERDLTDRLSAYMGAGVGAAYMDLDADGGKHGKPDGNGTVEAYGPMNGNGFSSDESWVFTAQLFAGLSYEVTSNFELYGGARWIYFDDPDFEGVKLDLDHDFLFEIGGRVNF